MARVRQLLGRARRAVRRIGRAPLPTDDGLGAVVLAEAERLRGPDPLRVVVVHGAQLPGWTDELAARGAALTLVDIDLNPGERHVRLTAQPRFDLVVDAVVNPTGRSQRFVNSFYQLRAGGTYVGRGGAADLGPDPQRVGALLERAEATRG